MIISLSGSINDLSRNLICNIIRYLTLPEEFSKMNADVKADLFYGGCYCVDKSDWKIKKFSNKKLEVASILTGIPFEKLEDLEFRKTFLGDEWNKIFPVIDQNNKQTGEIFERVTVHKFLNEIDGIHSNILVNALFVDYKESKPPKGDDLHYMHSRCIDCDKPFGGYKRQFICNECYDLHDWLPKWIISDTTHPNEFKTIKERGGFCVRVKGLVKNNQDGLDDNLSELRGYSFDYELDCSGTIEELIKNVKRMLLHFKII